MLVFIGIVLKNNQGPKFYFFKNTFWIFKGIFRIIRDQNLKFLRRILGTKTIYFQEEFFKDYQGTKRDILGNIFKDYH